jgi:hypothetical protein
MRNMQLVLFITAIMLAGAFMMPSHAQEVIAQPDQAENLTYVPISGNVTFDPDNFNGIKDVTELTIYARGPTGINNMTSPVADGSFSMNVPGAGTYSIWVIPSKLDYLNSSTNQTYSVYYPDGSSIMFTQNVTDEGLSGIVIPTQTVVTGVPMSVTPQPPSLPPETVTPQPTPGFTMLAALAAAGAVVAISCRKK